MSSDIATDSDTSDDGTSADLTLASAALLLAGIPFFVGGVLVIQTDTPPSLSPTLGMLSHALWALAVATLAFGVVVLLRRVPTLRVGLAGYLSTGVLGLAVLHGLQWVTWAYVDVRAAREGEHELVVDAIIVPFGAGHLLMYCLLVGSGIAFLSWALRRTALTGRIVALAGIVLGALTVAAAIVPLVAALGGGSEGHFLFDAATLLLPVLYLWAIALGIDIFRRT